QLAPRVNVTSAIPQTTIRFNRTNGMMNSSFCRWQPERCGGVRHICRFTRRKNRMVIADPTIFESKIAITSKVIHISFPLKMKLLENE
ncbi:hypothetical protein ABET15_16365, partial [Heyndrickxia faecalis]